MHNKKTFCVLPWIHSFVNNGGEYQVCCTGEEHKNFILNKNGKPFYLQNSPSIEEVMNSQYMKQFRLKLLNGEFPKSCERCIKTEEFQGESRRIVENRKYQNIIDGLVSNTSNDGEIKVQILDADYRLGNTCNLTCRMCNPRASKNWVKQHKELPSHLQDNDFKTNVDFYLNKNWSQTKLLDTELESKIAFIEKLHFGGGEPLYASRMKDLLELCIDKNVAKNITLSYNTNLTLLPKSITSLWKEFKEVKLLVSIDGIGELNNYIRYPSDFTKINDNLRMIDKEYEKMNVSEVIVSTTVQANNVFHLKEIYDYLQTFSFVNKIPNLILLYFPDFLQVNVLSKKMLALAEFKINDLIHYVENELNVSNNEELQNLYQIKNYFSKKYIPEVQKELFDKFIEFSKTFDSEKKLNLAEVNPEFKAFYNDT